jgi:hypothetical protein
MIPKANGQSVGPNYIPLPGYANTNCSGVLTKPDRIPTGEEHGWIRFIRNEREALDNNWYCVKQPSSNDIKQNITWTEARKREDDFFTLTAPWSELDTMYHKYLRTRNLVGRLSSVLSDLISKRSVFPLFSRWWPRSVTVQTPRNSRRVGTRDHSHSPSH